MTNLVMVPGMMCDERIFSPQIKSLSKKIEVTIADISGFSSVSELASDVLKKAPGGTAVGANAPPGKREMRYELLDGRSMIMIHQLPQTKILSGNSNYTFY